MKVLVLALLVMGGAVLAAAQDAPPAETLRILQDDAPPAEKTETPAASAPTSGSGSPKDLLVRGNALYEEERYQEALETYHLALSYGIENEVLHYNLGNTYFRLGMLGHAVLEYERAQLLAPGDDDIRANLEFARAHASDAPPPPAEGPVAMVASWLRQPSINGSAAIALIAYLIAALLFGLALVRRRFGHSLVWGLGVLALLLAVPPALVVATQGSARETDARAVVLVERVECRSGPGESNPVLFAVHEAATVEIVDERSDWSRITMADGINGWLPSEAVERVRPRSSK